MTASPDASSIEPASCEPLTATIHVAEPGRERRSRREQARSPEGGDEHGDSEADAAEDGARSKSPEIHRPRADERGDRGRESHGVVRVDDPGHVAEDACRHEEPAAPEQITGARAVGA